MFVWIIFIQLGLPLVNWLHIIILLIIIISRNMKYTFLQVCDLTKQIFGTYYLISDYSLLVTENIYYFSFYYHSWFLNVRMPHSHVSDNLIIFRWWLIGQQTLSIYYQLEIYYLNASQKNKQKLKWMLA